MYFGDSDGSDPFVGGLIEGNRVAATLGYNLQIKHQKSRPPEHPARHDTIIRYNVFSKVDAVAGPLARPNVLLGHVPLSGAGSEDRYLVYGNLFLHNPSEALLQAEGRLAVYDNVFINGGGDAIRIQPHNDVPRDMAIFSNTVLASGAGIQVRQAEGGLSPACDRQCGGGRDPVGGRRDGSQPCAALSARAAGRALAGIDAAPACTGRATDRLPDGLAAELAVYPDWQGVRPGARIAPPLLRTLHAFPP
jgi:hypothetical protein